MKKLIVGVVAVGAVIGLRHVIKDGPQKMRERCRQMMGRCAGGSEGSEEAMRQKMREHCGQMAAQHEERTEPVAVV